MTLYWWMHWFWITTLNFAALLFWGTSVQGVPSPFVPIVQNGHQNGPYMSKMQLEHPDKSLIDPTRSGGYQKELESHSPEYSSTTDENASQDPLRFHPGANAVRIPDTYLDEISESMSDEYPVPQTTHEPTVRPSPAYFPFKNPPITPVRRITGTMIPFAVPETNDDADTSHVSAARLPGLPAQPRGGQRAPNNPGTTDSMITWVGTVQSPAMRKDTTSGGEVTRKESTSGEETLEERPLGDGPYLAPTHSFAGGVGDEPKPNWKQQSATSTARSDEAVSTEKPVESRGKTVNREKSQDDVFVAGVATTQPAVLYVTPVSGNDSAPGSNRRVSEVSDASSKVSATRSTLVESANSSVEQVGLDWNASVVGVARSLARTPGVRDTMPSVSRERVAQPDKREGLDAASITGIAMGIITAAGLVGAISFVLYRRRYLNKPQTLNDSNPDSSGYLDDSTLREHSEEMYSLDNDSFLNSLEAMTIQNYWTDSVKHTKL